MSSLLETAPNYFAIAQDAETLNEESQRHCAVALQGNIKGELQHVTIDTGYLMGPIRIQMTVSLYPEGKRHGARDRGQLERGSGI